MVQGDRVAWRSRLSALALAAMLLWPGSGGGILPVLPQEAWGEAGKGGPCAPCARFIDAYGAAESDGAFQIVWVMAPAVYPKAFTLSDPERLVVDFEPAWGDELPRLASWVHPLLKGPVRKGWHSDLRRMRFVLDLLPGVAYDIAQDLYLNTGQLEGGGRFVLRISRGIAP